MRIYNANMFEGVKAKMLVFAANKADLLLLPQNNGDREIAESMYIDGAPVKEINNQTLQLWQERRKLKPEFVSKWRPAAETKNGPLQPLIPRRY